MPLSDRALAILTELPREGGRFGVPRPQRGRFINQDAMADVLAKLRPGVTVHGFRSTFRDWAAETTISEPRARDGAGARGRQRRRARLPARRPVREAPAADGGVGGLLRENSARRRSYSAPGLSFPHLSLEFRRERT